MGPSVSTSHTQSLCYISKELINDAAMLILKYSGNDKNTNVKDASEEVRYFISVTKGKNNISKLPYLDKI